MVDYRYYNMYDLAPAFPFGFGLSFSNFTFSDLQIAEVKNVSEGLNAYHIRQYDFLKNPSLLLRHFVYKH